MFTQCASFRVLFCALILASLGMGCGSGKAAKAVVSLQDQEKLKSAVQYLRSGELLRKMDSSVLAMPTEGGTAQDGTGPKPDLQNAAAANEPDGCPNVATPGPDASEEAMKAALHDFAVCMRDLLSPFSQVSGAINYFKLFNTEQLSRPLSELTDLELAEFLKAERSESRSVASLLGLDDSVLAQFRTEFSDEDLEELQRLVQKRKEILTQVERKILAAVGARVELVSHFAKTLDRYAALLALYRTRDDAKGFETAGALMESLRRKTSDPIIGKSLLQLSKSPAFYAFFHPYAIDAIVPSEGDDEKPLKIELEDPFGRVVTGLAVLGGPPAFVENCIQNYRIVRTLSKAPIPEHPAPSPDAVRVAFMDTGVDYLTFPELGLFLGSGKNGQLESADFVEGGTIPWMLHDQSALHGSQTMGSLLTLISQLAPEVLEERKLDLAMWKTWTTRNLLSGNIEAPEVWQTPRSLQSGLIRKLENSNPAPKIVSVSMSMAMQPLLEIANKPDLIQKSPWLWVMAAGNEGRELKLVDKAGPHEGPRGSCFSDIPREHRDASKILCVGALQQGMIEPRIAEYSNFGEPVDVYALESYIRSCPSGTSCSTPAISAAVTMIAAKFPQLTPAQLKEVIVESSVEKVLKVNLNLKDPAVVREIERGVIKPELKVRVFNPVGMMPRAYEVAQRKLKSS